MNFLLIGLWSFSIIAIWIIVNSIFVEESILKKAFLTCGAWLCLFWVISAALIFFDSFKSWKALLIEIILTIFVLMGLAFSKKKKIIIKSKLLFPKEEIIAFCIFILISIFLIGLKSERIALDSDQGAYYCHTSILAESSYGNVQDILRKQTKGIEEYFPAIIMNDEGEYFIHAFPTWCSLPALFWNAFGSERCMDSLTFLYFIASFGVYYVCLGLSGKRINAFTAFLLFSLTPLVLYIGKAGLAETSIMALVVFAAFLFSYSRNTYFYGVLVLSLLFFVHISFFFYLPIIIGINFFLGIKEKSKKHLIFSAIILFSYIISLGYGYKISQIYFLDQYEKLFTKLNISLNHFLLFLAFASILILIMQWFLSTIKLSFVNKFIAFIEKYIGYIIALMMGVLIIFTIKHAIFLAFTDKYLMPLGEDWASWSQRNEYAGKGLSALYHLNFLNICRATGVIPFILFLYQIFSNKIEKGIIKILFLFTVYSMTFYTVIFFDSPRNYYTSRYIVPIIIPFLIISVISSIKNEWICKISILILFAINKNYYIPFVKGAPFLGQREIYEFIQETIPAKSTVVFDNENSELIYISAYYLLIDDDDNILFSIDKSQEAGEYYFVTSNEIMEDLKLINFGEFEVQYSLSGDINGDYPKEIGRHEIPVFIYYSNN